MSKLTGSVWRVGDPYEFMVVYRDGSYTSRKGNVVSRNPGKRTVDVMDTRGRVWEVRDDTYA